MFAMTDSKRSFRDWTAVVKGGGDLGTGVVYRLHRAGLRVLETELAHVDGAPVRTAIEGVVRGLLADGLTVAAGLKAGDVDPRGIVDHCFAISDKALAVGGGVLEALVYLGRQKDLL
jgi:xanthine dehydrogenase accessory factor